MARTKEQKREYFKEYRRKRYAIDPEYRRKLLEKSKGRYLRSKERRSETESQVTYRGPKIIIKLNDECEVEYDKLGLHERWLYHWFQREEDPEVRERIMVSIAKEFGVARN